MCSEAFPPERLPSDSAAKRPECWTRCADTASRSALRGLDRAVAHLACRSWTSTLHS